MKRVAGGRSRRAPGAARTPRARKPPVHSALRLQDLLELTTDQFWETDAEHRVTALTYGSRTPPPIAPGALIGKRRWEVPSTYPDAAGWQALRADMDAHRPFRDFELARLAPDGSEVHFSISGEPAFDRRGRFTGYRGVGRDITAQKREESLLRLEHAVTLGLAEGGGVEQALQAVIRALCEQEGWDFGRFYALTEHGDAVAFAGQWAADTPALANFVAHTRDLRFARGVGLAGNAWASGAPLWIPDIAGDTRVARPARLLEAGLTSALAFPLGAGASFAGVLVAFSRRARPPDARLLETIQVIGAQVAQYLERKRGEDTQHRFRAAMDASADMLFLIDPEAMRYVDANETACRALGYTRDELLARGPQDVLPEGRDTLQRAYRSFIADPQRIVGMHSHYIRKDGSKFPFESTRRLLHAAEGTLIVAISRDISKRLAAEEALRESEARYRSLSQLTADFLWESDARHRLVEVGNAPEYQARAPHHLSIGVEPWQVPSGKDDAAAWRDIRARLDQRLPFRDFEFARAAPDGRRRHYSVSGVPRFGADGAFLGYRGVGREITETVEARERMAQLAYHDALTGLANRSSLEPALRHALERARRRSSKVAALFIDLDGFKAVNDTLGHNVGDQLLIEAARRLRACLRASDQVARLGGDEFVVALEDLEEAGQAEAVAHKVRAELSRPYSIGGVEARVSASIGMSLFPDDAADAALLVKHADLAMYQAKQAGKDAVARYRPG